MVVFTCGFFRNNNVCMRSSLKSSCVGDNADASRPWTGDVPFFPLPTSVSTLLLGPVWPSLTPSRSRGVSGRIEGDGAGLMPGEGAGEGDFEVSGDGDACRWYSSVMSLP